MWSFGARRLRLFGSATLLLLAGDLTLARAQDEAEESPFRPGLVATYAAGPVQATRVDEVVAFDWQQAACDPRLPAGRFTANWRGRLWARGSGEYRLACYVQGKVNVAVAGKTVIAGQTTEPKWLTAEPLALEFDHHPLEISYERTEAAGQLALFWAGPDFLLEPVSARALMHDREQTPATQFERGRQLATALRCGACHMGEATPAIPAPALDQLTGNVHESWLVQWLSASGEDAASRNVRRMPHLGLTAEQASAVAAWLVREPAPKASEPDTQVKIAKNSKADEKGKKSKAKKGEEKPRPSAEEGERVLLSRGCLGCHNLGPLGESGLYGGGDLSQIVAKRPVGFLTRWLQDPSAINRSHRMPLFSLNSDDLESVRLWEEQQGRLVSRPAPISHTADKRRSLVRQGEELVGTFRCANCHLTTRTLQELTKPAEKALTAKSDWARSCLEEPTAERKQPGYGLANADQAAIREYYSQNRPGESQLSPQAQGRELLVQLNCLACHQREGIERAPHALPASLQEKLTAVAADHSDLAPLVPAMTPPALNGVGDKLHDTALADSINRQGPPHRPYLLVQMPKFRLSDKQLKSLTAHFTATDRIPNSSPHAPREETITQSDPPTKAALLAAGPRMVTTDGLACTSCHQVGSVPPAKAPLNARGPDLSLLEKRIRKPWFDRWCADPARIVPRMEMPSVKIPVRGVLGDNVKDQLEAVWLSLNTPGFEPPEPNPVRTLRLSGVPERNERPIVIHDVLKDGDKTYLFPLVIGLPNRHNILFDLETNRLAAWWLGDTARQRTKGKSWYWEMGGKSINDPGFAESELSITLDNKEYLPTAAGQFLTTLDTIDTLLSRVKSDSVFHTRVLFELRGSDMHRLNVSQIFRPGVTSHNASSTGFRRGLIIENLPPRSQLRLRLVTKETADAGAWDSENREFLPSHRDFWIRVTRPHDVLWSGDGSILLPSEAPQKDTSVAVEIEYGTGLPVDQYFADPVPAVAVAGKSIDIAPGFRGTQLPLAADIMPSGLAWRPNGQLAFATLKGQVYVAHDSDSDGVEDASSLFADGLPTPYGVYISRDDNDFVDVATKVGLVTLRTHGTVDSEKGQSLYMNINSSGWGHTDDYHDWCVGPVQGGDRELFIALPCQQDQRSEAAAAYRGKVLRLALRETTDDNPRMFDFEVVSAGHRFPMGMARNRDGELFVTDNQGNYNPFNELNHVRKGAHFGFINALEKQAGYQPPPLTPPAINIPHPWTRSVNGICFLDTPVEQASSLVPEARQAGTLAPRKSLYGPLEGHLIGCEYDTRRLIRMSLQKIGDTYQGAAYPLSIPTEDVEKGLLGPIVCAIKPTTGELYVGEIRDSGWGASNNIGQIVKIKIEPEKLPCGIAEVRATSTGFTIDFFQPVDAAKALDTASYQIESYRRESTPAYGGSDIDRRSESDRIKSITLSPDKKRATLTFSELRTGHVYEFKLKNLTPAGGMFHPDEAHYSLNQIPAPE